MGAQYDVAIVGAGIHGAGVAQAAAAAGFSVLLLEQSAVAAGSSSRSSKLVHGGLRYLESGQWRLVRESLHERTTLLRLAPELVHLRRFLVPVYGRTRRRPWQLRLGLSLYAALAGPRRDAAFGTIPASQWDRLDGLTTEGLQRVFWYHDAQTDDRALTRAVVASAQRLGTQLLCPARCTGVTLHRDGVELRYVAGAAQGAAGTAREVACQARVLINAAGPWAGAFARAIEPAVPVPALELVQGTHLVLPGRIEQGIYYLESPRDGRAIFVMPWQGRLLIGTTETRFHGEPSAVRPAPAERRYLLGVLRHYFPRYRTESAVADSFAGLRVLPAGPGHAFNRTRETLLVPDRPRRPRVLSVYGGKLTTWRAVADRVLHSLAGSLPSRRPRARTDQLPLPPADDTMP